MQYASSFTNSELSNSNRQHFNFCRQFYAFVLLFLVLWFYAIFDNTLSISSHCDAIKWQIFVANDIKLIEMFAEIFLFLISDNCFKNYSADSSFKNA